MARRLGLGYLVAFWALVIWLFLNVVRTGPDRVTLSERVPEEVLADRFARGEIDEDEYRRSLDTLHDSRR